MPDGAWGILLKLKLPNRKVYADKFGLILELCSRLRVIIAWGNNLSHSAAGYQGLMMLIQPPKNGV